MSHCIILKGDDGRLRGSGEANERAFKKWRRMVADLPVGQTLSFSFRLPRSLAHHRHFFRKLEVLLDQTEAFDDATKLRHWLLMGAGHCDFVPGLDGKPNAIPKSMDFEAMDEAGFCELQREIDAFLWTGHAQAVLWPALDVHQRWACMESFMGGFER